MSRFRHAAMSLASGYAALGVTILYQLASVPLALHYLSKHEFGVWALVTQVSSYLLLIDLGITAAVSRTLIDHKDHKEKGEYGSVIKTGSLVLVVQGAFIALGGALLSLALPALVDVPAEYVAIARLLTAGQCVLMGCFFVGQMPMGMLQAHQRFDAINYGQMLQLTVTLGVQWVTFRLGWGLYSLLAASAAGSIVGFAHNLAWVFNLRLFPPHGAWGQFSPQVFREVFVFGRDLFLLTLGNQLLNASQLLIISRTQGLTAVTVWSVATKTFMLAAQSVSRIFDFSGTALGEMIVRGERENLRRRLRDVMTLTSSAAIFAAIAVAVCNASFLAVWTNGEIEWPWRNDALMGLMIAIRCVSRCYVGLSGYAKQIRTMRWIYFVESVCFVILAFVVSRPLGMSGIILASILSNLVWSGIYGIAWGASYLGVSRAELVSKWLRPAAVYFSFFLPPAALLWWATLTLQALPRLLIDATMLSVVGVVLFWCVGLTDELRQDLKSRLARLRKR